MSILSTTIVIGGRVRRSSGTRERQTGWSERVDRLSWPWAWRFGSGWPGGRRQGHG